MGTKKWEHRHASRSACSLLICSTKATHRPTPPITERMLGSFLFRYPFLLLHPPLSMRGSRPKVEAETEDEDEEEEAKGLG